MECVVVSCPSGKTEGGVPGALQFEAHPCARAVGFSPVVGKLPNHLLSVTGGEGLQRLDDVLAAMFEPLLIGCFSLVRTREGGGVFFFVLFFFFLRGCRGSFFVFLFCFFFVRHMRRHSGGRIRHVFLWACHVMGRTGYGISDEP